MSNFSKDFLSTVGEIAVNSTFLEFSLTRAISKLMSCNTENEPLVRLLFASNGLTPLLGKYKDVVIYLLRDKDLYKGELLSESKKILSELKNLIVLRNKIIHSFWKEDKNGVLSAAKYKRNLGDDNNVFIDHQLTRSDINELPSNIINKAKELTQFNNRVVRLIK